MSDERIEPYLADGSFTVVEAMQKIDSNGKGILFITDEEKHLLGSVTDGDIRRWLIKSGDLSARVTQFMHQNPKYIYKGDNEKSLNYGQLQYLTAIPVLDANEKVVELIFDNSKLDDKKKKKNHTLDGIPVIIMAGGKGTRLYPYTKILPKPLIPIGDIPIIERIINRFCEYGVTDYYLTVNYKKGMIKSYFTEMDPAYKINYIEENKPLGTAGSIRLITEDFRTPVIVTNCDILIDADYEGILKYHRDSQNAMTIVAALKNIVLPYGVLHSKEQGIVTSMEEKPNLSCFVNTGMYVLNPELICEIPADTVFNMTDLVNLLMEQGRKVGMYPVSEDSFLDMGEMEEMRRMEEKLNLITTADIRSCVF